MSPVSSSAPQPVLSRERAFMGLSAVAGLLLPLILALGRFPGPRNAAAAALAFVALSLIGLGILERRGHRPTRLRDALLVLTALATAPLMWFFGPNSGAAAVISLLVLLTGLLGRKETITSWLIYAALTGGQLLVVVLVLLRALPDESLQPLIVPGHPDWQHFMSHLAVQGIHLACFLSGRALRDRYDEVLGEIERTVRAAALKTVLLDEARADYRRAVRALKKGVLSRGGVVRVSEPPPLMPAMPLAGSGEQAPSSTITGAAPASQSDTQTTGTQSTRLWMDAYRNRMRRQHAAVLVLCVAGSGIIWMIGEDRTATVVGMASMALTAMLTVLQRELAQRRGDESGYWPWALIGALSAGVAYAFGLHSAFSSVVAALLFFGGFFRAAPGAVRVGRRLPVLLAVCGAHGLLFLAIWFGVLPDVGNLKVLGVGDLLLEPVALHLLLQGTYVAAFVGAYAIDTRFEVVLREASRAQTALVDRSEQLTRAGQEIARALEGTSEGLFTGDRVGRYAVGRLLASGAMGDVYEARVLREGVATRQRVALKLVRADRLADPIALELLAREAGTLSRIESPAVARILEAGVEADLPYVAMELIEGESLADILRERGRLRLTEVQRLAEDLGRGLKDIHDAGVIHRDLKPHNVMRAEGEGERRWKIVDFGLSLHGAAGRENTGGTAAYMAPEQALGERVDPRADLYSACLVIYRALTGRPAFVGTDPESVARAAREAAPPDPRSYVEAPADLVAVLRIGLAAHAADRFTTARELASALTAAFEGNLSEKHRARAAELSSRSPWARASA